MTFGSPIPSTAPTRSAGDPDSRAPSEAPRLSDPPRTSFRNFNGPRLVKPTLCQRWERFPTTPWMWFWLTVLTGAGAFLRFWRLGFQSYWTDEASTIVKIRGSFDYMLARLSDQGFPPGWYALLRSWCLAIENFTGSGATAFSPVATRTLTAIIGTLTVPAMYFLARQFTDRKGALLVTLLAAVNPFLIYYSRDIKMYPAMWFFVVLNMAIFFRWQTTHRHAVWFPLFLLTGCLMTAMQSMAWFIVGLEFLFLITRPRLRSLDGPLWLTGTGIMALLPVYWYTHRTGWIDRLVDQGSDGGLAWITRYTDMSWKTLVSLPCSHLLGYLWPVFPNDDHLQKINGVMYAITHPGGGPLPAVDDKMDWARIQDWFELSGIDFSKHLATRTWAWMPDLQAYVAIAFFAILLLGLIPWRGLRRTPERLESVTQRRWWWVAAWLIIPTVALAATWIPDTSPWHDWIWHDFEPRQIWEPRYLGMLVPAWLLWMGASLRRLPLWPLRTLAIVFVVAACTISSLSNHLILRNAPFQTAATIAMKYYDPNAKQSLAVGNPSIAFPQQTEEISYAIVSGNRPTPQNQPFISYDHWMSGLMTVREYTQFLATMRSIPAVKTIVLTDRFGDVTDPKDPLSDESTARLLTAKWKLVETHTYEWHYEWRFYIFHTWRTRVWVRVPPTTAPAALPK